MKRQFFIFILSLIILMGIILVFSPFKPNKLYTNSNSIVTMTEIDRSAEVVFNYLGNSDNASKWSVFVNHITPLNPDKVPDGQVGSERRCFYNEDETGLRWDETILINEKNKRRRISCYNLIDFPMEADNLATEQIYEAISGEKTRLIFTVFYLESPDFITKIKTKIGAWYIQYIFNRNLKNIKTQIEKQPQ